MDDISLTLAVSVFHKKVNEMENVLTNNVKLPTAMSIAAIVLFDFFVNKSCSKLFAFAFAAFEYVSFLCNFLCFFHYQ